MRVFAAVEIPEEVKRKMLDASKYFALKEVTLVKADALHITLHFFGEVDERHIAWIADAMDLIKTGGFEVTLHGISFFKPERIRVVYIGISNGADKITMIHNALLRKLNIREQERFVPHATIARVRGLKERKPFMELASEYEDYDFGTFNVDSITLKKSTLSESGPSYENLHESKL